MNVLFIAVDDLNHWVGHLGRNPQTKTPEHRPAGQDGRHVHPRLLRRAGVQSLAGRADVRPATEHDGRLRQRAGLEAGHREGADAHHAVPQGRLQRLRRGQDLPQQRPPPGRVDGVCRGKGGKLQRHPSAQDDGVGGIKFCPLDCRDEDMPDYEVGQLRHREAQPEARQAVLPGRRPAQAAHAVQRAEEVLRHVPARNDPTAAPSRGRSRRCAGRRGQDGQAGRRSRRHCQVRPLEGRGAGVPGHDRLLRRPGRAV